MSAIRLLQQTEQQINKLLRVILIQFRGKGTAFFCITQMPKKAGTLVEKTNH